MVQTLMGLTAYAGGLRDKMFHIFNMFGVCCSSTHIRRQAKTWGNMRNVCTEINKRAFWRI